MKSTAMLGYKLVRFDEDNTPHMIRVVGVKTGFKESRDKHLNAMKVYDYDTGLTSEWKLKDFKDYSPIEPDGVITVSIAIVRDNDNKALKDVVVTASRYIDMKLAKVPYVVCRQNVVDMFYNLLMQSEENNMVGISCNQDTAPANFDFRLLLAANSISEYKMINFYRIDTLEEILKLFDHKPYDNVLAKLYEEHCKATNNPKALMKKEDMGYCKDLDTLLSSNGFKYDINQMLGITDVNFTIKDYIVEKDLPGKPGEKYESVSDDMIAWLSSIYNMNITDLTILKFDHDIDIVEFKNTKYFLMRDDTNTLYLLVYNENGEQFVADLDAKSKELDFSTKFKLDFYSKYNNINTDNIVQYK